MNEKSFMFNLNIFLRVTVSESLHLTFSFHQILEYWQVDILLLEGVDKFICGERPSFIFNIVERDYCGLQKKPLRKMSGVCSDYK